MSQTIWLIGGDARSHWAAHALSMRRFSVCTHEVVQEQSLPLPDKIEIAVLPFPSFREDMIRGSTRLSADAVLQRLGSDSLVFGGLLGTWKAAAQARGAAVYDLYGTEPLTTENARLTAEAAVQLAMQESIVSLFGRHCLVIGYGRIGKCLSHLLRGMGANVTVAARKQGDFAMAEAMGCQSDQTGVYLHGLKQYDFIFNTVPAQVLNDRQLKLLSPQCLLMELASGAGGFSAAHCQFLGLRTVFAGGLPGRCFPKSAGIAYAQSILSILCQEGV